MTSTSQLKKMPYPHEQDWIPSYKDEWPWGGDPNKKFKGVQLNSNAHVSLCKELAKEGFTFSFEAFTFVPELQQVVNCQHARIDLVVYHSDKYLMIEIDGEGHFPGGYVPDHIAEAKDNTNSRFDPAKLKQHKKDLTVGRYMQHLNFIRFTASETRENPGYVVRRIGYAFKRIEAGNNIIKRLTIGPEPKKDRESKSPIRSWYSRYFSKVQADEWRWDYQSNLMNNRNKKFPKWDDNDDGASSTGNPLIR